MGLLTTFRRGALTPYVPPQLPFRLPADLRARVQRAAEFQLAMGGDFGLPSVTTEALHLFRFAETPPESVREAVADRLDQFLDRGRAQGLSAPLAPVVWSETATIPAARMGGMNVQLTLEQLAEKYRLRDLLPHSTALTMYPFNYSPSPYPGCGHHYVDGAHVALRLAEGIGDARRLWEAAGHLLRLQHFGPVAQLLELHNDNAGLYHVGLLLLAEWCYASPAPIMSDILNVLGRIRGELKPAANQLLVDLACALTHPEYEAAMLKQGAHANFHYIGDALEALRLTGDVIARSRDESSLTLDVVTRITDSRVSGLIRHLLQRARTEYHWPFYGRDLVRLGVALNDPALMCDIGEHLLRDTSTSGSAYYASQCFAAAGDRTRLDVAWQVWEPHIASHERSQYAHFYACLQQVAATGEMAQLFLLYPDYVRPAAFCPTETLRTQCVPWTEYYPMLTETPRLAVDDARQLCLSAEKRAQAVQRADALLRNAGNWAASGLELSAQLYLSAEHRAGLIAVGDQHLRGQYPNTDSAMDCYLLAAQLEPHVINPS